MVVNLYQFEKVAANADAKLETLIENIDIGGPTMIRSAAKNYQDVAIVVSPADYDAILAEMRENGGDLTAATRWRLAQKAFRTTADYDRAISARLASVDGRGSALCRIRWTFARPSAWTCVTARIRINPRRCMAAASRVAGGEQLGGKELSYNNLVDLDAAWQLAQEFERPAAAIIKHTNPCGCGEQDSLAEAIARRRNATRYPLSGAWSESIAQWTERLREKSPRHLSKRWPHRISRRKRCDVLKAKKNLRLLKVTAVDEPLGGEKHYAAAISRRPPMHIA